MNPAGRPGELLVHDEVVDRIEQMLGSWHGFAGRAAPPKGRAVRHTRDPIDKQQARQVVSQKRK